MENTKSISDLKTQDTLQSITSAKPARTVSAVMTKMSAQALMRTAPENVQDVLDAIARLEG